MDEVRFRDRLSCIRRGRTVFISNSSMHYYVGMIPFEDLPLYLGAKVISRVFSNDSGVINIEWGSDRWDDLIRRRLYGSNC